MWVMFEDLPTQLSEAFWDEKDLDLLSRPIQRPFSEEELADLVEEIRHLDPAAAVCDWNHAEFCDPYGFGDVPHLQVGREYYVQAPSGRWVWFGDLPDEIVTALNNVHRSNLAFPAGLEGLEVLTSENF
jgi:hypothetical protein